MQCLTLAIGIVGISAGILAGGWATQDQERRQHIPETIEVVPTPKTVGLIQNDGFVPGDEYKERREASKIPISTKPLLQSVNSAK